MYETSHICIVCLKTPAKFVTLTTSLDRETDDCTNDLGTFTFLECYQVCTGLTVQKDILYAEKCFCFSCVEDLKVTYNFLRRAEESGKILQETIQEFTSSKTEICANEKPIQEENEEVNASTADLIEFDETAMFANELPIEQEPVETNVGDPLHDKILCVCSYCDEPNSTLNFHTKHIHTANETNLLDTIEQTDKFGLEDDQVVNELAYSKTKEQVNNFGYYAGLGTDSKLQVNPPRRFRCCICMDRFKSRRDLQQHCLDTHRRAVNVVYQKHFQTNKKLDSRMEISKSFKVQHEGRESYPDIHKKSLQVEEEKFSCCFCFKTFSNHKTLNTHIRSHKEKSEACSDCGKRFSSQTYLKLHMEVHRDHRERTFQCTQCDKVYLKKSALTMHLRMHTGDTLQCEECGKDFISSYALKVHMRFHNRQFPFMCEVCGKSFAIQTHLRGHMLRHQGLKFKCNECGKLFLTAKAEYEHAFTHTTMPYPCSYCEKAYPSKQKYKFHLRTIHSIELDEDELRKFPQHTTPQPCKRRKVTLVKTDMSD